MNGFSFDLRTELSQPIGLVQGSRPQESEPQFACGAFGSTCKLGRGLHFPCVKAGSWFNLAPAWPLPGEFKLNLLHPEGKSSLSLLFVAKISKILRVKAPHPLPSRIWRCRA